MKISVVTLILAGSLAGICFAQYDQNPSTGGGDPSMPARASSVEEEYIPSSSDDANDIENSDDNNENNEDSSDMTSGMNSADNST
jgi:hypothetical protein